MSMPSVATRSFSVSRLSVDVKYANLKECFFETRVVGLKRSKGVYPSQMSDYTHASTSHLLLAIRALYMDMTVCAFDKSLLYICIGTT